MAKAESAGGLGIGRQLAKRLLPLTFGVGILISTGPPATYFVLEYSALRREAAISAENLATKFRDLTLEAPSVWKYQKYRHREIFSGFLPHKARATIRVLDEAGGAVIEHEYGAGKIGAWWDRYAPGASAPIIFNNRTFGTVQVRMSQTALLGVTLVLLLIFTTIGAGLAVFTYSYPVRVVTGMEGQIQNLIQDLRQSEASLAEAQMVSHTGSWKWDVATGRVTWSDEMYRIYGYQPQEFAVTFEKAMEPVHAEDRDAIRLNLEKGFREFVPPEYQMPGIDYRIVLPGGEERVLRGEGKLLADEQGRPTRMVGIVQDVTERKHVEEEIRALNTSLEQRVLERTAQLTEREDDLRKAKTFLEQLIAASPGMIFLGNVSDLSFHYVSPNIERILGYAPESVLGIPGFWLEHIHPDHRERFLAERQRVFDEKLDRVEYEVPFRRQDGTYRWLSSVVLYKYGDTGKPLDALGYNVDITERKTAEGNIKQAKEEAERASLAKSEFLSRMSHELRTPLNAILGFAQLLEMDTPTGEARESVEQILKGGNHLLQLINEVLDIARIEAGRLAISPEPVSVNAVVQESLDLIAPLAAQRNVQLSGEPTRTHDVYVQADRQRLKQVLLNLLSNAVKYNRKEGTVVLSCQEISDGRLRISVSDTGTGIPPEMLERLFLPFERLGVEKTGLDGTGIGLALSKGLVELMGGDIGVESQVGQGSTFWVDLAVAEDQAGRYERMREEVPAPGRVYAGDHPRTVLYIEDNLSNLELIQRLLVRWPVKLLSAMQGRLGLELARQYRPDLILVDLHLPDITGDEILRRLRETPETSRIPVVVISADPTQGQVERLLALGARDYLPKPLDVKKLMGILHETLKEGAAT